MASLLGDALVIRILQRMDGLAWLRWSAVGALVVKLGSSITAEDDGTLRDFDYREVKVARAIIEQRQAQ